jgi:histidine triad (HIT) family protein
MSDCIFCKIVKGEIPAYKVYEDDKVYAFLDINPLSKGHTLVLPKEHYVNVLDTPKELYGYMSEIVKKIAQKIEDEYEPEGILINQNNGRKAGQEIDHVHIHIKPIYEDTKVFREGKHRKQLPEEEMKKIQQDLTIS